MMHRIPSYLIVLACLAMVACEASDPITGPDAPEIAGTFTFTELRFVPDAPALPTLSILDTLVAAETRLQLFDSGDYVLTYRFIGGSTFAVSGTFTTTALEIQFRGRDTDQPRYELLLLTPNFSLQREGTPPTALTAEIRQTSDLARISPRYRGLTAVDGRLRIRLVPQAAPQGSRIQFLPPPPDLRP
jgi:hypothetical protein